jgi:tRNA threonylcarbamoyladenosine biosynthesis protein TsaB
LLKILALETSSDACSVALWQEAAIIEHHQLTPMQHTEWVLSMLEALLAAAHITAPQLNVLAFGCGPGSFAGLRVAAAVIQALGFALNLPVVPVSTLQVMAQGAYRETGATTVLVAVDARREEVYWGAYQLKDGIMQAVIADHLLAVPQIPMVDATVSWLGIGNAWTAYPKLAAVFPEKLLHIKLDFMPHARDVVTLANTLFAAGKFVSAEQALPVYLRDASLWKKL